MVCLDGCIRLLLFVSHTCQSLDESAAGLSTSGYTHLLRKEPSGASFITQRSYSTALSITSGGVGSSSLTLLGSSEFRVTCSAVFTKRVSLYS